jgi:hypothetical protein
LRNIIALVGATIGAAGAIPYILDTIKGKTHPNIVTWVTYTIINTVSMIAAYQSGAIQTAIFGAFGVLAVSSIAVVGIKHGVRKYTAFDIACQILAIAGIIAWRLTGEPAVAVSIMLAVFAIASAPTWRHAWLQPFAETWEGFFIGIVGTVITLASLADFNFVSLAMLIAILCNNTIIIFIVLSRRRVARAAQAH